MIPPKFLTVTIKLAGYPIGLGFEFIILNPFKLLFTYISIIYIHIIHKPHSPSLMHNRYLPNWSSHAMFILYKWIYRSVVLSIRVDTTVHACPPRTWLMMFALDGELRCLLPPSRLPPPPSPLNFTYTSCFILFLMHFFVFPTLLCTT